MTAEEDEWESAVAGLNIAECDESQADQNPRLSPSPGAGAGRKRAEKGASAGSARAGTNVEGTCAGLGRLKVPHLL
jgi:hypothetical protein